ncbi:MAG: DUF4105 domain-containing protein [Patescibacteria group bacterium]
MAQFIAGIVLTLLVILGFNYFTLEAKLDRPWIEEQSKTAIAEISEDEIIIRNARDWTYDATGPLTKEWVDLAINPKDVKQVWFVIEPFGDWKAVGHTFLTFEFNDGGTISFSIEARREEGEKYEALAGAFRAYDLSYQWGTERDFITRRLVYLNHPVRMYPLDLPQGAEESLLHSLAEETNVLAANPRFYNTLTANCTNLLAQIVNKHYPGTLPRHYSWILTGYSDTYLMREGFIQLEDASEARTQMRYDLTQYRESIGYAGTLDPYAFSKVLRLTLDAKE